VLAQPIVIKMTRVCVYHFSGKRGWLGTRQNNPVAVTQIGSAGASSSYLIKGHLLNCLSFNVIAALIYLGPIPNYFSGFTATKYLGSTFENGATVMLA
jgi:hypothetical protein